jgi:serine phosphatase RsbU (regulator of sigma subunit)
MENEALSDWEDRSTFRLDRRIPYLRLLHFAVFVRDQDRSLKFYLEQLGFSLVLDYRFSEHSRFIVVGPPDGTASIALIAPATESEEYKLIGQPWHAVFVTEDVIAQFNIWRERGVHFRNEPQVAAWGGISTTFEDLDGNSFVLVGWDEISKQVEAGRRAIAEQLETERRSAQEVEIAKQVQARLFPQTAPSLASLDYSGICIQAREVGGDYYDFLDLGAGRLGLVIADISGKGMASALLMANLQANLRSQFAMAVAQPQRFLQSVNRLFYENTTDSVYATLFFAEYDDNTRHLRYSNCGHLSGFLFRRDQFVERLESTGTVLGLFKEWDCSIEQRDLLPGDSLLLYTDGVTEAFNDAGEDFGEERLIETFLRHQNLHAEALLGEIVDEVRKFSPHGQHDDITVIVAKCMGSQGSY